MVCNLLGRERRKNMSSGQYSCLLQEGAKLLADKRVFHFRVSSLFSSSSSAVLLLRWWGWSGITPQYNYMLGETQKISCVVKRELQAHHYGGSHFAPKWSTVLFNTVKPGGFAFMAQVKTWQYGLAKSKSAFLTFFSPSCSRRLLSTTAYLLFHIWKHRRKNCSRKERVGLGLLLFGISTYINHYRRQ